jgi:hypothetical protein
METNDGQMKRIVLKRMGRCRVCHRSYTDEDVSIVSRKPDLWMMVVECLDCHAKNFVAAVLNEGDPAQAELALRRMSEGSDLVIDGGNEMDEMDEIDAPSHERVDAGDVADMHTFLREFDGDFLGYFNRQSEKSR